MLTSAEEEWEKKLSTTGIVSDTKQVVRCAAVTGDEKNGTALDGLRTTHRDLAVGKADSYLLSNAAVVNSRSGFVKTTSSSISRSNRIVETAEQWRKRLWPSKAITSFVRIITRCSPPLVTVGESLFTPRSGLFPESSVESKGSSNMQNRRQNPAMMSPIDVGLRAHWTAKELHKVPESFHQDISLHSSIFFLLAVEECRACCVKAPEFTEPLNSSIVSRSSGNYRKFRENERYRVGVNGWVSGEVTAVLAESELSSLPKACEDPRLGSVWVLAVAVYHASDRSTTSAGRNGSNFSNDKDSKRVVDSIPFGCGDLLIMQSEQWAYPIVGIVQPWDPDYDLKYGVNFSINQSSYIEQQRQRRSAVKGGDGESGIGETCGESVPEYSMINIMVCVESAESAAHATENTRTEPWIDGKTSSNYHSASPVGGWAEAGAIRTGVCFHMAVMGNTTTSIRECQALMSLRYLDNKLKNVVLSDKHTDSIVFHGTVSNASASGVVNDNRNDDGGQELDAVPDHTVTETADTDSVDYNNIQEVVEELNEEAASALAKDRRSGFGDSDASENSSDTGDEEDRVNDEEAEADENLSMISVERPSTIPLPLWNALLSSYNPSQLRAIAAVCPRDRQEGMINDPVTLLQGPPGTGKTRTILGLVAVLLSGGLGQQYEQATKIVAGSSLRTSTKVSSTGPRVACSNGRKMRVLICAPSNTAVDELVYRIVTQGILGADGKRRDVSIIRVGQSNKEDCHIKQLNSGGGHSGKHGTANRTMQQIVECVTLENVCERRMKDISRQSKSQPTRVGSGSHGSQLRFADVRKQVLEEVDVVCSTLSGAGSQPLLELVLRIPGFNFDAVIIDEAAQAIEPSALIPFKYNPTAVVLVGDPCQLPATVFSRVAKKARLGKSLFQRLQQAGYPVLMLETQYRMHPAIVNYPSRRFYRGNLRTGADVRHSESHKMPYHTDPSGRFRPFLFHHCSNGIETREGVSICNREEARYVIDLFEALVRNYPDYRLNIGIIAPYRAQRRHLFRLFQERFSSSASKRHTSIGAWVTINNLDTEIATVDGFQGREKDIVIFSCVRAPASLRALRKVESSKQNSVSKCGAVCDAKEEDITEAIGEDLNDDADLEDDIAGIGFLREWQRLNVAITRAKYALWIVGNANFLQRDKEWMNLIENAQKRDCFLTVREDKYGVSDPSNGRPDGTNNYYGHRREKRPHNPDEGLDGKKRRKKNSGSCYAPQLNRAARLAARRAKKKQRRQKQRDLQEK